MESQINEGFFCNKVGFRLSYGMCLNRQKREDKVCRGCKKGEEIKEKLRKER